MSFIRTIMIAVIVSVTSCSQHRDAKTTDKQQSTLNEKAESLLNEVAAQYPALNASVSVDGEIVWEATGGTLVGGKDGATVDYNVYSVAKMFTGLAYARLVFEYDLSIDTPIREIDPALPQQFSPVTLGALLSHIGGIRHYTSDEDWNVFSKRRCKTPPDALSHFINDPLIAVPGDVHQYSTYGFTLLSHLLVKITRTATYDEAMASVLGEHSLAVTDNDDALKATNYAKKNDQFQKLTDVNAQCKYGGGGILASARDMALMGEALYSGKIIKLEDIPKAFEPVLTNSGEVTGHAFGMDAGKTRTIQPSIHFAAHSGGSPGGRSYLVVLIEPKVSVGLTANFDGPGLSDLGFDLAKLFAGIDL